VEVQILIISVVTALSGLFKKASTTLAINPLAVFIVECQGVQKLICPIPARIAAIQILIISVQNALPEVIQKAPTTLHKNPTALCIVVYQLVQKLILPIRARLVKIQIQIISVITALQLVDQRPKAPTTLHKNPTALCIVVYQLVQKLILPICARLVKIQIQIISVITALQLVDQRPKEYQHTRETLCIKPSQMCIETAKPQEYQHTKGTLCNLPNPMCIVTAKPQLQLRLDQLMHQA